MDRIFISYSSKEYETASKLRSAFSTCGLNCWMAPESIPVGSNYAIEIPKAIHNCEVFLIILSVDSQNSMWVRKEIDLAVNKNKHIVPIVINKCEIISPFDFYLTNVQMIQESSTPEKTVQLVLKRMGMDISEFRNRTCFFDNEASDNDADDANAKNENKKAVVAEKNTGKCKLIWECLYCGASNSTVSAQCSKCGRLRNSGINVNHRSNALSDVNIKGKSVQRSTEDWICPDCGTANLKIAVQCCKCGKLYWNSRI